MKEVSEQALKLSADKAWERRWVFPEDPNGDGLTTITDVWAMIKWGFFAPGDWLLLVIMKPVTPLATFSELTPAMLSGLFWATDVPASVASPFVASVVASLLSPDHSGLKAMRRDLLSRVKRSCYSLHD